MEEFIRVVLLFFCYSFIGWLWETVYCSIKAKRFVYRGFLVGPITPIYGFGILAVLYFLQPFHDNLFLLYIFATVLVTILEYVTSFGLEKLFHASWWDYRDVPLNLNGRVALPVSLFWGIGCVVIVKFVHPQVAQMESWLAAHFGFYLPVILIAIIMFDLGYTLANLAAFQAATKKLNAAVEQRKTELRESFDQQKQEVQQRFEWLNYFKDHPELKEALPKLNFNQRRLLKNFSQLKIENVKSLEDIRQLVENLRKK
ncbi:putative ABC transporter permease [Enterococcus songbeiensis]|uniref:putative ABC transporter permease n=1 Tax=Enterococcus songbeiensis TaxID=2559927 RepID=UPI0010F84AD6|nr:putative ABC transporter permease [Enterococcus songbeiensis]